MNRKTPRTLIGSDIRAIRAVTGSIVGRGTYRKLYASLFKNGLVYRIKWFGMHDGKFEDYHKTLMPIVRSLQNRLRHHGYTVRCELVKQTTYSANPKISIVLHVQVMI